MTERVTKAAAASLSRLHGSCVTARPINLVRQENGRPSALGRAAAVLSHKRGSGDIHNLSTVIMLGAKDAHGARGSRRTTYMRVRVRRPNGNMDCVRHRTSVQLCALALSSPTVPVLMAPRTNPVDPLCDILG